jgi:hypothetical protein
MARVNGKAITTGSTQQQGETDTRWSLLIDSLVQGPKHISTNRKDEQPKQTTSRTHKMVSNCKSDWKVITTGSTLRAHQSLKMRRIGVDRTPSKAAHADSKAAMARKSYNSRIEASPTSIDWIKHSKASIRFRIKSLP